MDKKINTKESFQASWDKVEEKDHPLEPFQRLLKLLRLQGYDQRLFAFSSHQDLVLTAASEEFWAQTDQIRFLFTEIWKRENGRSALEQLMQNAMGNLEELSKLQTIYDATHQDLNRKKDKVEVLLAMKNIPEELEKQYDKVKYPLYNQPVLKIEVTTNHLEDSLISVLENLARGDEASS